MDATRLHGLLRDAAQRAPEHPAFIRRGVVTSYGELDQAAGACAAGLRALGVQAGDRVALVLDNLVEYLVAYYGILKAGAVVVPLCPDTRASTLAWALGHCRASAVILEGKNSVLLQGKTAELPALRLVVSLGAPQLEAPPGDLRVTELGHLLGSGDTLHDESRGETDLCSIIYTSGTTARPKGVMLSHRNLLANTRSIVEYLQLGSGDVIGMVLPFFYSYGNSILHTHVCVGGTIAVLGSMAFPAAVLGGIQQQRCTGFSGVPSTFARLMQANIMDRYDLSSLRYLTQAGGPMTTALTEKLRTALPRVRIYVMYGQTEAAARLSYLPPEQLERKVGSVGIAVPGVTLRVLDKEGVALPAGEVGEVVARGDNIMMGYWDNPEETARVLRPEGLRTGDLARTDEDGYLWIVGRESDMIKSGAHRIGPKEIEEVVEAMPEVAQCAVVGVPDEILGEAIVAFVVPVQGQPLGEPQVLRVCHEHLPRFKMPSHVRIVDSLPRTDTGKLRRSELREWYAAGVGLSRPLTVPGAGRTTRTGTPSQ
jgi:acyl-CoA synthetase (AMP-forming)/AMP-acid ligase II